MRQAPAGFDTQEAEGGLGQDVPSNATGVGDARAAAACAGGDCGWMVMEEGGGCMLDGR